MANLPAKRGGRSPYQLHEVVNPSKGLNNLVSDNLVDDKESTSLENIMFVESGAVAKAYGYTNVGTGLSNNPRGLGYFSDTIGSNKYLYTVDGTALKYLSGGTWTTVSGASFDASGQINFTQAQGAMFVFDGVNAIAKIASGASGGTLTRDGHAPKAKFGIYYLGRHFVAGVDGQPNRVYYSKALKPAEFTVATGGTQPQPDSGTDADTGGPNVPGATAFGSDNPATPNLLFAQCFDVAKFDGDKITGLATFQNLLIIFKERSIYQLSFDSSGNASLALLTKNYGCISHRSIDTVQNNVFFLTRNGVYVLGNEPNYFNVIRTNELSARIHPEIELINPTKYSQVTALFNQYVYYMGIPSGGVSSNNKVITYDTRFGAFSKLTHVQPECFTIYTDSTNTDTLYFTSANSANVYKMTTNYDANGSAISAQWTSKAFDLGDFSGYKRWISLDILFRQLTGQITVNIYTDNGNLLKTTTVSSSTVGGLATNILGGGDELGGQVSTATSGTTTASTNIPYRFKINTKSRSIKIQVSNSRINESFVVLGLKLRFRPYSSFIFPSSLKIN